MSTLPSQKSQFLIYFEVTKFSSSVSGKHGYQVFLFATVQTLLLQTLFLVNNILCAFTHPCT